MNCSDAAGNELDISKILGVLRSKQATTGLRWDANMGAPFFNAVDASTGEVAQYWFDDARSLAPKYSWARAQGLAGVGPYCFNMLPLGSDVQKEDARQMWSALEAFFPERA